MMKFHQLLFYSTVLTTASSFVKADSISTDETLTRFYLWTRENPTSEQELLFDDLSSIQQSNFDAKRKIKVLVHGYCDGGKTGWVINTRNQFLEKGN